LVEWIIVLQWVVPETGSGCT